MTSLNKLPLRMVIPVVSREYNPGACRNSRKPMRLPPPHKMRPDSPALHVEQLRFPNQTHKEPRFDIKGFLLWQKTQSLSRGKIQYEPKIRAQSEIFPLRI